MPLDMSLKYWTSAVHHSALGTPSLEALCHSLGNYSDFLRWWWHLSPIFFFSSVAASGIWISCVLSIRGPQWWFDHRGHTCDNFSCSHFHRVASLLEWQQAYGPGWNFAQFQEQVPEQIPPTSRHQILLGHILGGHWDQVLIMTKKSYERSVPKTQSILPPGLQNP